MSFVVGQRVRVRNFPDWPDHPDQINSNHFIVGHFGHIESISEGCLKLHEVRISHGPDGGPPDPRATMVCDHGPGECAVCRGDDPLVWPFYYTEIEAVD
jgi:hypothetical protein